MNLIAEMFYGSHLHGLCTEHSDIDYRGVFIPKPTDILLGRVKDTVDLSTQQEEGKMSKPGDIDRNYYSLRFLIEKLLKGDIGAIDMLHATDDKISKSSRTWEHLVRNRTSFYTKNMTGLFGQVQREMEMAELRSGRLHSLDKLVMVLEAILPSPDVKLAEFSTLLPVDDINAYFIDDNRQRPEFTRFYRINGKNYQLSMNFETFREAIYTRKKNYGERMLMVSESGGTNWKSLCQALRIGYQLLAIYRDGDYAFPLPENPVLLKVKSGELPLEEVQALLSEVVEQIDLYRAQSDLPEELPISTIERWENFVVDIYGLEIRRMQNDAVA